MLTALSAQWGRREPAASPRGMGPSVRAGLPGVWVLAVTDQLCDAGQGVPLRPASVSPPAAQGNNMHLTEVAGWLSQVTCAHA